MKNKKHTAGQSLQTRLRPLLLAMALGAGVGHLSAQTSPPQANALPHGALVRSGSASWQVSGAAANPLLRVQQQSDRVVLDWQNFDIGRQASVRFEQPNAQSVALNQIRGAAPSQIEGQLMANGRVYLSNPQGVLFSPTAQVDVGGLVATTLQADMAAWARGESVWLKDALTPSTARVENAGVLRAAAKGFVALMAPEVRNLGTVSAPEGTVALGHGDRIRFTFNDQGGLKGWEVSAATLGALVENREAILAPDGQVLLSAVALHRLQAGVIQQSGRIQANSLRSVGGRIVLEADRIELASGSVTEANGALGGGEIRVGGDWQGQGALRSATEVRLEKNARVAANATQQGTGGSVVLWSDVHAPQSQTTVLGAPLRPRVAPWAAMVAAWKPRGIG